MSIEVTDNDESQIEDNLPIWKRRRYHLAFLVFIGFMIIYTLRFVLCVGIIAMLEDGDVEWGAVQSGLILGSFFYGYIVTQIFGGIAVAFLPDVLVLGIGILISSVLTLASPTIVELSFIGFFAMRVIIGLVEGFALPSMNQIWTKWAPPLERTRLIGVQHAGKYVGTVLSLCTCGIIAFHAGWSTVFYVYGGLGCIWSIIWIVLVRGSPEQDWFISDEEKQFIESKLPTQDPEKKQKVPLKLILTSLPVWAIIVAHFTENWGLFTMLTLLPSFLHQNFGLNISQSGYVSAIPYLVFGVTLFVAGFLADWFQDRKMLSTSQVRRYFSCISFLSQGVFMMFVAYSASALLVMMFISFGAALGALSTCGYAMNHLDIAPQYSSIIRGISSTIGTIPGIVAPLVAGFIVRTPPGMHTTTEKTVEEAEEEGTPVQTKMSDWKDVFIITAHIYFLGCIFYWFYSSGEVQPWAKVTDETVTENNVENISSHNKEDVEGHPVKKKRIKKKTNRNSSNQPNVHKNSTKNGHDSPGKARNNNKDRNKNNTDRNSGKKESGFLKMYDRFANYLSRIFRF